MYLIFFSINVQSYQRNICEIPQTLWHATISGTSFWDMSRISSQLDKIQAWDERHKIELYFWDTCFKNATRSLAGDKNIDTCERHRLEKVSARFHRLRQLDAYHNFVDVFDWKRQRNRLREWALGRNGFSVSLNLPLLKEPIFWRPLRRAVHATNLVNFQTPGSDDNHKCEQFKLNECMSYLRGGWGWVRRCISREGGWDTGVGRASSI